MSMSMLPSGMQQLFDKIKRIVLRQGGQNGIRGLGRAFRVVDADDDMQITRQEFEQVLVEFGVELSAVEVDKLMKAFDLDGDGKLAVVEFLTSLRGKLPPRRKAWIVKVWKSFPKTNGDNVPLSALRSRYDASTHPDVLAGGTAEEDARQFIFDSFNPETNPTGLVSKEEFECFYAGVSACTDNDEHFALMMHNTWRLGPPKQTFTTTLANTMNGQSKLPLEQTPQERMAAINHNSQSEQMDRLIATVKQYALSRAGGVRGLGRAFRILDNDNSGFLNTEEFIHAIKSYGLPIQEEDAGLLLETLDVDGDGNINFDEFLLHLRGDLPPRRKKIIERCFHKFDTDGNGAISTHDLVDRFQVTKNPLVVKGKMTSEEVMRDFLAAFESSGQKDSNITYEEFEEYYAHISSLIENDKHFEIMLQNAWRL
eukprot:NODE_1755_length_1391_cov_72.652690_g1666_i0.p1 GENE.NODE_1755_length_1391_cov_72.652690_g1666_i0~~NODE_1755_length_1391_cov_72.652690_g1666_i0.p1  ORF type:complete len:438 (-),score=97.80 NODE_1755_length_1391_cov_72.652690_g1666_i0:77-1354(-)